MEDLGPDAHTLRRWLEVLLPSPDTMKSLTTWLLLHALFCASTRSLGSKHSAFHLTIRQHHFAMYNTARKWQPQSRPRQQHRLSLIKLFDLRSYESDQKHCIGVEAMSYAI